MIKIESFKLSKTKPKSYNIPIMINPIITDNPTIVTILITKLYNILITNTLQYTNLNHITFTFPIPSQY